MTTLEIRFTNDMNFKFVHDLLMEEDYEQVTFIEENDGVNPEVAFIIANLIESYTDKYYLTYTTFRNEFPDLVPDVLFRGIPFNGMNFNGTLYVRNPYDGKLIRMN